MADFVTSLRIVFALCLLFFAPVSPWFFVFYVLAGISDMIDGPIARKTGSAGKKGAVLDTAADICLFAAAAVKILLSAPIPLFALIWASFIALVKLAVIVSGFVSDGKLPSFHTVPNKITGVLLFVFPFTVNTSAVKYSSALVCLAASVSAVHEATLQIKYLTGKKAKIKP